MNKRKMLIIAVCIVSLVIIIGGIRWYKSTHEFELTIACVAPEKYPSYVGHSLMWVAKKRALGGPEGFFDSRHWSANKTESCILSLKSHKFPMPKGINLLWLSLSEYKSYYLAADLDRSRMCELWKSNVDAEGKYLFSHIVVGMAPYGGVAIWMSGFKKAVLVDWMHGREAPEVADRIIPKLPNGYDMTLKEFCDSYTPENRDIRLCKWLSEPFDSIEVTEWKQPPAGVYDGYMEQFRYRYVLRFENWESDGVTESDGSVGLWTEPAEGEWGDSVELSYLWEHLFDGTYDKINDGRLFTYHTAGKPSKLHIDWQFGGSIYDAYFWMDDKLFTEAFNDFYGQNHDADTDIIIRIDPNEFKFKLSFYRCGLEPVTIPEDAYQILVFKDDLGCFRSKNYSMYKYAWNW